MKMLPADTFTKGAAKLSENKTTYAVELFKKIPADAQERIIALIQFLLTEQEQCPSDRQSDD